MCGLAIVHLVKAWQPNGREIASMCQLTKVHNSINIQLFFRLPKYFNVTCIQMWCTWLLYRGPQGRLGMPNCAASILNKVIIIIIIIIPNICFKSSWDLWKCLKEIQRVFEGSHVSPANLSVNESVVDRQMTEKWSLCASLRQATKKHITKLRLT